MVNKKIQMTDDGENLFPASSLIGYDISNVIAELEDYKSGSYTSFTAPEECFMFTYWNANGKNNNYPKINGHMFVPSPAFPTNIIHLKRGDVYEFTGNSQYASSYVVYGISR